MSNVQVTDRFQYLGEFSRRISSQILNDFQTHGFVDVSAAFDGSGRQFFGFFRESLFNLFADCDFRFNDPNFDVQKHFVQQLLQGRGENLRDFHFSQSLQSFIQKFSEVPLKADFSFPGGLMFQKGLRFLKNNFQGKSFVLIFDSEFFSDGRGQARSFVFENQFGDFKSLNFDDHFVFRSRFREFVS